jgi:hypothetical protein
MYNKIAYSNYQISYLNKCKVIITLLFYLIIGAQEGAKHV